MRSFDPSNSLGPRGNRHGGLRATPAFEAGGLVLGAGTLIAPAMGGETGDDDGGRLALLLKVAYGRSVSGEALGHVKVAVTRWRQGDEGRAALHLALARLGRMPDPITTSQRLCVADELLQRGVAPNVLGVILDDDVSGERLQRKYNPDQPRNPAGSGVVSGRWTDAAAAGLAPTSSLSPEGARAFPSAAVASQAGAALQVGAAGRTAAAVAGATGEIDLGALSAVALRAVAVWILESGAVVGAAAAAPVVLGLGIALAPNPGPRGRWVRVGGPNDISFRRNLDEQTIRFRYKDAEGKEQLYDASPGPDGNYRGPDGRVIARWVKAGARLALAIKLAAFAAEQMAPKDKEPKRCPAPGPDHPGARPKNRDYEDVMKRGVNPEAPTPRGVGYALFTPDGRRVVFDDCQQRTGWMFDAKGPGYAKLLLSKGRIKAFTLKKMVDDATRQTEAAGGRQIFWVFAEKSAGDVVRKTFKDLGGPVSTIKILTLPWHESMR